jgi:hypothetical protein
LPRRHNRARHEGIHADAEFAQLSCEAARHTADGRFTRCLANQIR